MLLPDSLGSFPDDVIHVAVTLLSVSTLVATVEEDVFSLAFVCLLAGLCKNYSTDFHKIMRIGGTWANKKKRLDFGSKLDHVALGLGLLLSIQLCG